MKVKEHWTNLLNIHLVALALNVILFCYQTILARRSCLQSLKTYSQSRCCPLLVKIISIRLSWHNWSVQSGMSNVSTALEMECPIIHDQAHSHSNNLHWFMMNSLVYDSVDSDSPDVQTQLIEVKVPPIITFTCYYLLTDFWHVGVNQFFFFFVSQYLALNTLTCIM